MIEQTINDTFFSEMVLFFSEIYKLNRACTFFGFNCQSRALYTIIGFHKLNVKNLKTVLGLTLTLDNDFLIRL